MNKNLFLQTISLNMRGQKYENQKKLDKTSEFWYLLLRQFSPIQLKANFLKGRLVTSLCFYLILEFSFHFLISWNRKS